MQGSWVVSQAETSLKTESLGKEGKSAKRWGLEKTNFSMTEGVQRVNEAHLQDTRASTKCPISITMKMAT